MENKMSILSFNVYIVLPNKQKPQKQTKFGIVSGS